MFEKYNKNTFYSLRKQHNIMVLVGNGFDVAVLQKYNIPFAEYTPLEVKQVLTGYGRATKKEVEQRVKLVLNTDLPKLDDTVDAIAIAICHTRNMRG